VKSPATDSSVNIRLKLGKWEAIYEEKIAFTTVLRGRDDIFKHFHAT